MILALVIRGQAVMTNIDILVKSLESMDDESVGKFKSDMIKVGTFFKNLRDDVDDSQAEKLDEALKSKENVVVGLSKEADSTGNLGMTDDELFAMFFFTQILKTLDTTDLKQ